MSCRSGSTERSSEEEKLYVLGVILVPVSIDSVSRTARR